MSSLPGVSDTFDAARWREARPDDVPLRETTYHRLVSRGEVDGAPAGHDLPVVRIAFDRPELRNAFGPQTVDELYRCIDDARSTPDVAAIILTGNGIVAEADPNLPTLTEYFDYSCHACADLDVAMGQDLTTWASQGHFNLEIQPVITVNMDYLKPAAGASLVVAQKAPDKWVEFHHALLAYFRTQFQASNGKVVQNLDASWKQVKEIAAEVGVPASVINTFPVNAVESYLETSTNAWRDAGYSGRESGLGTPELVKNRSTVIPLGGQLGALRQSIMQEYGITDSTSQSSGQDGASDAAEPSQSGDAKSQSSGTTSSSE